jgi:hypothetical protein
VSFFVFIVTVFVIDGRGVRGIEEPPADAGNGMAETRVVFANFAGGVVRPGSTDSRRDRSSLVAGETYVPPAEIGDGGREAVVTCLAEMFAPFGVEVTDVPPADDVRHVEVMFGGRASDVLDDVDDDAPIAGVSPFRADCGVIEDSIVFVFTEVMGDDYREICETAAQEIGHSYGLDHQLLASDPMTYLSYSGERRFRDQEAACGEDEPRPCGVVAFGHPACREMQNTAALLRERLGDTPIDPDVDPDDVGPSGPGVFTGGCSAGPNSKLGNLAVGIVLLCLLRRRRNASRTRHRIATPAMLRLAHGRIGSGDRRRSRSRRDARVQPAQRGLPGPRRA